jgi:hypothetical protein
MSTSLTFHPPSRTQIKEKLGMRFSCCACGRGGHAREFYRMLLLLHKEILLSDVAVHSCPAVYSCLPKNWLYGLPPAGCCRRFLDPAALQNIWGETAASPENRGAFERRDPIPSDPFS